jgi:subfamily B ATP-binding cassette protein MsbA
MLLNPATRKFLSYAKPYRWWIASATVCGLLKYNIPVIFPWLLKDIIDHLLTASPPQVSKINTDIALLAGSYLLWSIATFYRSYLADRAGQRMIFDLRRELYVHLQRMSLSFFEKRQVGSITSRLVGDIAVAQNFVGAAFTNTVMDMSSLLLITILVFSMNWKLAFVSLVIFPFYVVLNRFFKKRIRSTSKLAQQKMEEISGDVNEKLGGISVIQSYTREKAEEQHFLRENRTYLSYRLANIKNNALAAALVGFLTSIAPVLVVWYGALQVIYGNLTVGQLTAFYAYLGMFYQPLNRLTELNILLANSEAAIERIFEFFNTSPGVTDRPTARGVESIKGDVVFENVSFGYDPTRMTLKNINLSAPAGSIIALVGRSGAGKSTFVKLIPRFYDVSEGAIKIDGIDIRDLPLKQLRRHIALVPQDPILFSGTIYENILMGNSDATREQVDAAARSANALDFILQFPSGFETEIGEGGLRLSGGQKQRVALTRAFLKNAPILILDEATSSLDAESDNLIQEALQRLMQGRTTFIIAHRLSTIQSAHRIVVFDGGRIVEMGTHAELLNREDGLYRRLHQSSYRSRVFVN